MKDFRLKDIRVKDIMSTTFHSVVPDTPIKQVIDIFLNANLGEVLIIGNDGELQGVVTKKSIMRDFAEGKLKPETLVRAVMHHDVITLSPESDIRTARHIMRMAEVGRLPILDSNKRVIGILTAMHICNGFADKLERIGNYLNVVLDTTAEALLTLDTEGRVIYWNKSAENIFEIPAGEIIGRKITDYFKDACSQEVLTTGEAIFNVYSVLKSNKHILKNASPIIQDGKLVGVVCSALDITQTVKLMSELSKVQDNMANMEQRVKVHSLNLINTNNAEFQKTLKTAERLAATDAAVLILGESGTGKEMLARAIHQWSPRQNKVFIPVNCAAIPGSLCESEFFGYVRGAFTGASKTGQPGKFELADGGTIFLDEIGELPYEIQGKLLRVLEEKAFYRIGGSATIKVNIRVITATNRDLEQMVRDGKFREDLYYRLSVFRLTIPPLRERTEDIPALFNSFLTDFSAKYGRKLPKIDPTVIQTLSNYNWRGNVRELRNFAERLIVLIDNGSDTVSLKDIQDLDSDSIREVSNANIFSRAADWERECIINLLNKYNYNKAQVARLLNIPRSTLYYKMKVLNIQER